MTARPTEEEIARVRAWEQSERARQKAEERARQEERDRRAQERLDGCFKGKRVVSVTADAVTSYASSVDVWGLSLGFDDGSSLEFDVYDNSLELTPRDAA